ncbi:MAG TPA: hypothetical protein VEC35_23355 [Noviherbaspirillum sp.]|nr:hypothetical protein [Noviherbaspirillum sp.]
MAVTTSNKKATDNHALRCAATGLYLADATTDFHVISVTPKPEKALPLADLEAAEHARKFMRSLYGSFDWQSVPLKG